MTVERYNLGDIKRAIRGEFALQDAPDTNDFLNEQINKAHLHIARARGRWQWQMKEEVFDIPDSNSITVTAVKGSRTLTLTSGSLPSARAVLVYGNSNYGTQGYIVESSAGTSITLKRQWLGASATVALSVQVGYLELPEDFYALDTTDEMSNIAGEKLKFFDTQRFQYLRNQSQLSVNTSRIYTIMGDPINVDRSKRYIAVYPYYGSMDSIYYTYYYVPAQLVTDADEPILPLGDRPVLLDFALWFVAQSKGYDKVLMYRDMALGGLNDMLHIKDEDSSSDFDAAGGPTLDMSATRDFEFGMDSDYSPTII